MTRDEILEMAREAWRESGNVGDTAAWFSNRAEAFEAFARKVEARAAAAEREACAQICEFNSENHPSCGKPMSTEELSSAIRARGAA